MNITHASIVSGEVMVMSEGRARPPYLGCKYCDPETPLEWVPSEGYEWNGWLVERESGFSSFVTGGWWEYLDHLKDKHLNEMSEEDRQWLLFKLKTIEREWKYVSRGELK